MSHFSRSDFHSRTNPFDEEPQFIPAWGFALAIALIALLVIVR